MKRLILFCYILPLLLCLSACSQSATVSEQSPSEEAILFEQFFKDAGVPVTVRVQFAKAIRGDGDAQEWISEYTKDHDDLNWSVENAVFSFRNSGYPYSEDESLFNIGMFYYEGNDYISFSQDKAKAFAWFKLSADKGSSYGAVWAGDIARYGDGIPVDEQTAFDLYAQAIGIEPNGSASDRLGDCYAEGIGTVEDRRLAFKHYLDSACMGYAPGLYKLAAFEDSADINLTALYKAASSLNYSGGYWAVAYGGLSEYSADAAKRDMIEKLLAAWESGTDPVVSKLQKAVRSNEYFSKKFVNTLAQTVYTYSYHAFAEEYGIWPNYSYENADSIQFASDDDYVPIHDEFYEYDFDGDGVDEVGISVFSGAGGAFQTDGFAIYKKNADGLYESYSGGPDYTLRDAMRIIKYDEKIYFIVNQYDDTENAPFNIVAYTIDRNGRGHTLNIDCNDYNPQRVIMYTDDMYNSDYDILLANTEKQMREAITATKQGLIYSPEEENQLSYHPNDNMWSDLDWGADGDSPSHDVFFAADVNNDGVDEVIHKGRFIRQFKYYDDYNWFHVYRGRDEFDNGMVLLQKPEFYDEFYGRHSGGNLYHILPVGDSVVQFWTQHYNGVTYCITLQRYKLLYTLRIYEVQEQEIHFVSKSLFFDEAQGMDVSFS